MVMVFARSYASYLAHLYSRRVRPPHSSSAPPTPSSPPRPRQPTPLSPPWWCHLQQKNKMSILNGWQIFDNNKNFFRVEATSSSSSFVERRQTFKKVCSIFLLTKESIYRKKNHLSTIKPINLKLTFFRWNIFFVCYGTTLPCNFLPCTFHALSQYVSKLTIRSISKVLELLTHGENPSV